MQDQDIQSVALKTLLDECVALSRPDTARSTDELWFTFSKEFRVRANHERLKNVLVKLLTHGMGSEDYREVKVWISRSPVLNNGIRLGFRGAIPWPAAEEIMPDPADREWLHLEYESESNVRLLQIDSSQKQNSATAPTSKSEQPSFSVLWADLNLCREKKKPALETQQHGGLGKMAERKSDNFRVLYIEDNSANLSLVETALTHREHVELLSAGCAEEGIKIAEAEIPDLILLDINLPGIDGYEALYRLTNNALTKDIPIIAVSANALSHDVERAKKAGARDYLVKPYSISKFFAMIDEWAGHASESLQA